jgi:GTP-binding protein
MQIKFLLSTLTEFPTLKDPKGNIIPEVALAGRSNVGKSSLINHWLQKKVARASQTPGKTQLLNFFLIDEKFVIVDLPGYGFARAPIHEQEKWSKAIDEYLNNRKNLKLILLLIDSRRGIEEEDQSLIDWANLHQKPILIILTKTDKLSRPELESLKKNYTNALFYSVHDHKSRVVLDKRIQKVLWG